MKDLIKKALFLSGYHKLHRRLGSTSDKRLIIMMYHDLIEDQEATDGGEFWGDKPTQSQFAAHLKASTRSYRVVSVEDAVAEMKRNSQLAEDSVAITFDDGYASVYEIAFPLLKEHNVPATVFLLTDWIDNKMSLWWEELAAMFDAADFGAMDVAEICRLLELGPTDDKSARQSDREGLKRRFQERIETAFRDKAEDELRALMDKLKAVLIKNDNRLPTKAKPMTWAEIREMAGAGINFGAHTCSHINLRYANRDLIEKEIVESKRKIEHNINREVKGFAYPYGQDLPAYDKVEPILRRLGFAYACIACPGANNSQFNPFFLRRDTLPSTTSTALLGGVLGQQIMEIGDNPIQR